MVGEKEEGTVVAAEAETTTEVTNTAPAEVNEENRAEEKSEQAIEAAEAEKAAEEVAVNPVEEKTEVKDSE